MFDCVDVLFSFFFKRGPQADAVSVLVCQAMRLPFSACCLCLFVAGEEERGMRPLCGGQTEGAKGLFVISQSSSLDTGLGWLCRLSVKAITWRSRLVTCECCECCELGVEAAQGKTSGICTHHQRHPLHEAPPRSGRLLPLSEPIYMRLLKRQ
jgi:hypothetical protein